MRIIKNLKTNEPVVVVDTYGAWIMDLPSGEVVVGADGWITVTVATSFAAGLDSLEPWLHAVRVAGVDYPIVKLTYGFDRVVIDAGGWE